MKKTKVCHITPVHEVFDDRIFHKECKTIAKAGIKVCLIAQHHKNEIVNGVEIVALPVAKGRFHRIFYLTFKAFWLALRQRADIYHFHDPEFLPVGIFLKLLTGKRVVYDVHEDYSVQILSKQYLPKFTRKLISFLVKVIELLSAKFFDGIITVTDGIQQNFLRNKKVITLKNYPDLSCFSMEITKNDNEESTIKNIFYLVYIGAISETRGIIEMVQSLEYINKPIRLVLCGKFDSTDLESKVKKLKGYKKVKYLGFIEHEKVAELLGKCDIGLVCLHPISNYLTALPIKMFEYMAMSLPVIASDFPLWKEIVEENRCGICVNPLNPKEIAKSIDHLLEQPELRKQMGENGKNAVLEKYNWEKEKGKLFKLYREILANDY